MHAAIREDFRGHRMEGHWNERFQRLDSIPERMELHAAEGSKVPDEEFQLAKRGYEQLKVEILDLEILPLTHTSQSWSDFWAPTDRPA